jgi:hypothetical protein
MNTPEYQKRLESERASLSVFTNALRELLGLDTYDAIAARKLLSKNRQMMVRRRQEVFEERRRA